MSSNLRKKNDPGETLDGRALPQVLDLGQPEGRTELANARRFISRHGDKLRFVPMWGKWLVWRGTHWQTDDDCIVESLARDVPKAVWRDIGRVLPTADRRDLPAMQTFAKSTASAKGIANFLHLARSEPGISTQPSELDQNEWLLNVQNETIDLRTGTPRPHDKRDLITKLSPVVYRQGAQSELWLKFVSEIMGGDAELIGFLQRLCGYWLTGSVRDHILPIFYGTGANGKSVFLGTIEALLGTDFAMHAPPDLLLAKRHESHPTERADLFGKRLVCCVEADSGRQLAESLVKELTGGDLIRARRMREDNWQFSPSHKLVLAANHRPIINGSDHGIWRRLLLIPFNVTISPERQDKALAEKLKGELSGILNWAIEGCLQWQTCGLSEPPIVLGATSDYREEQDIVSEFIEDRCDVGTGLSVSAGQLFSTYVEWCKERGCEPDSNTGFGTKLTERGHPANKVSGSKFRQGIALKTTTVLPT